MKLKNLALVLLVAVSLGSCVAGRVSITPPSSETALNNFVALRTSIDSFFTAPNGSTVNYTDKQAGYAELELRIANLIAQDSLRPNHGIIIKTDLLIQKNIVLADLEHQKAASINYYKFGLYAPLLNHIVDSRITQEKSLFNVKQ